MWRHLLAGLITAFWLVMTGLLIRVEMLPDSALLRIPLPVVAREMFAHNQTSMLALFDGERRLGSVILQPRLHEGGRGELTHSVRITGNTAFPPLGQIARLGWDATLMLNARFDLVRMSLDLDSRRPVFHLRMRVDPTLDRHRVEFAEGEAPPMIFEGSLQEILDQILSRPNLRGLSLDAAALMAAARQLPEVAISATRSHLAVSGRKLETFRVVVSQGTTTAAEVQMTPLGQILTVRTELGLRLIAEDLETLAL